LLLKSSSIGQNFADILPLMKQNLSRQMKEKIQKLAGEARFLEPDFSERSRLQTLANDYAERFLESLDQQKAYTAFDETAAGLLDDEIPEMGEIPLQVFQDIENRVVHPGLNTVSGRHFGYIPGGGLAASAAGDYLAAVTNRYAGVYSSSPGAASLETRLVRWMCELIGYPVESSGGYLASGGSIANLTAIITARDDAGLRGEDFSKAVVYLTRQTHHCVDRALNMAGLRESPRRYLPMDENLRMKPEELKKAIREDRSTGKIPWLIVGSAGSTDTGAIDPLDEIGEIALKHQLWFHVDAAYGGFFILTDEGKQKLKGIAHADSVVLDPHKGLFLPYGTGALLVKDVEKLAASHRFSASYMRDTKVDTNFYSPAEISPELSKHFRGLRMWLPLKLHGVKAFRSSLEEKLLLARYLWKELNEAEEFETGPQPQLSVFMFRWRPEAGDTEEMNRKLHQALLRDGRVFLSTTEVHGTFFFRVAVLSVRTHLKEADELLNVLKETTRRLKGAGV
jgi:aromatic-L-amino-acid/L-tryptophan decarboxylase